MALSAAANADDLDRTRGYPGNIVDTRRSLHSAVSWGAIAGGAAAAASLSQGFPTTTTPAQAA